MTAGPGSGPYGDAGGRDGNPEQPGSQGGGGEPPPYGQSVPGQPPYGQPPYGQPPYGQPPYGPGPYGQQPPYGQQSPYPGYAAAPQAPTGYGTTPPVDRPVTVRAGLGAFVGSIVLSLVSYGIVLANLDTLARGAAESSALGELSPEEAEVFAAMGDTFGLVGLVFGVIFTGVFALFVWFAWRGHNWARIVLWVLAGLGIIITLLTEGATSSVGTATLPVLTFLTWVELLFDVVAVVLLALAPSNEWYRYRGWLRSSGLPG